MCAKGVLESNRVLPVLKRDLVSSPKRLSVDVEAERESENKEQAC